MEEPVRILHLHGGTSADVDLNLHPQITVVRGLHDPARQWCIDTIGHLAVGRVSTASGEVEASGIRFSLTDKSLSTLGLVVAHSSVVVAADLRPPVSESANGGASGGATTGVHGALAFETGPADTVGMDIAGAQEPEGGGVDLHGQRGAGGERAGRGGGRRGARGCRSCGWLEPRRALPHESKEAICLLMSS